MVYTRAKYCDEYVCVCLSVCEDISGIARAIFTERFLCMLSMDVATGSVLLRRRCDTLCRLLPVLWMTSLRSIDVNEHVYVCVCLSASISPEPHARSLPNFCACCLWLWLGPPSAGWRNPKRRWQFLGFSSPMTMHCSSIAFETIRKQLNRSRCRLA